MKAEIVNVPPSYPKPEYPYLAKHRDETVVLFLRKDVGIVAAARPRSSTPPGYYSETWQEVNFEPLPPGEAVQLSN